MAVIGYLPEWSLYLHGDPLAWVLERDNPSARYLALTQLLGRSVEDLGVSEAQAAIVESPPGRDILEAQYPRGYWVKPDRGYSPKYRATIWQVLFLAELGSPRVRAIEQACAHVLGQAYLEDLGLFSAHKGASGVIPCLNGNLLWALRWFGYGQHPVVRRVNEQLAEAVLPVLWRPGTGREGFRCRYNAQARGDRRSWLPCAWGAIKVLRAFAAIPVPQRSPKVEAAIQGGVEFLLDYDLAVADYPNARGISRCWFQLGFPLAYESDILEGLEVLAGLGRGGDPRLHGATKWLLDKQDQEGRWPLERTLSCTWASFGECGEPSKWVTLRALRTLAGINPSIWVPALCPAASKAVAEEKGP